MTESSELGSGCGYQQPNPQAPDVSVLSPLRASTPMNLKKKKKKLLLSFKRQREREAIGKDRFCLPTSLLQEVKNSGGGCFKGGVKHSAGTWWCGEMECGSLEPGKPHPWVGDRLKGGK